jgi:hypothetical protein
LYRANVIANFKQMGCEAMPQGVATAALWYLGLLECLFHGFL